MTPARPKERTVRAWAVLEASGFMVAVLPDNKQDGVMERQAQTHADMLDVEDAKYPPENQLGPHVVVPLTGRVQLKARKARRKG